ncbi:related to histone deacetylase [Ustilago trichophora]|uniref:histone deacetylase n=1 Tax=Ustilago trichophora TaxID=86804 RepID=A0A5C3EBT3_9BASI|nr:related to histone deacetylase [Ustilago trichophora]
MSVVTHPPRVAYIASGDLVMYSDLLPSNKGRSSLVHSLAYHLDLLDLQSLDNDDDEEQDKRIGSSSGTEKSKLLSAIAADASSPDFSASNQDRRRATVYLPHPATNQQLSSYHEASFVNQLSKDIRTESLEASSSSKRRKVSHFPSRTRSSSPSGTSDTDGSSSSSSAELRLRPSSSVSGSSRQRGYKRPSPPKNQFGLQDDCPTFSGLHRHISLVAGASITAAELLATGKADVAIAWDGGRHHAKKDCASGFCYVNDVVLAILALRRPRKVVVTTTIPPNGEQAEADQGQETLRRTTIKRVQRVMYLDLDLHWGDGVEEAFHTSSNVLTLSIHHYAPGFFPCYAPSRNQDRFGPPGSLKGDPGAGKNCLNIPLSVGTSNDTLERVLENTVQSLVDVWQPEMVVVQCGVDGLAGDPMAVWNLSAAAYVKTIQRVLGWKKPTLLLGGGGYNSENAARCWSLITAACLGRFQDDNQSKPHAAKPNTDNLTPLTEQQIDPNKNHPKHEAKTTSLDNIGFQTPIPDHKFWPNYAPQYTLDVAAGEMIDQNDQATLQSIHKEFLKHIQNLNSRTK